MKQKKWIPTCNERGLKGVITVELSYLLPIILMIFLTVVYVTFYYHDKNILIGAASETAAVGAQLERKPDENGQTDLAGFYQDRIQGKLILFSGAEATVNITRKWVEIIVYAERRWMQLHVVQRAAMAEPETAIRRLWMLEKAAEAVKKEEPETGDDPVKIKDDQTDQKQTGQIGTGTGAAGERK